MGLYNNVADSLGLLGAGSLLGNLQGAVGGGINNLGGRAAQLAGGGALAQNLAGRATSIAGSMASSAISSGLTPELRRAINGGGAVASNLLAGNFQDAAITALDAGLADRVLSSFGSRAGAQMRFWRNGNPLYGGISPGEARQIHSEATTTGKAKKNLFLVKVSSLLQGDFSRQFNLFCVDIEHTPFIVSGDKFKVGAAFVDMPNASEVDELRITTLDDKRGTMKRWFEDHAAAVAARDGTVGVPGQYAITFTIEHAFVGELGGFKGKGLFRPVSYDVSLSRRDDALEEIQMTFTQIDTFMEP
ncbi:hypothetical protein PU634_05230 [Oceanimonas pelagia]|uniref:Uncharacterized protein n=1 Tax=Oceanimonas pelagia TaxID=3028314 RepID=A0AA50QD36_9GAMM|nr:hypothetical protein [Oceanimonas pelagia]WMC11771.1 hypothetical protein PU634_05230 [Oceanimonas pelagia]